MTTVNDIRRRVRGDLLPIADSVEVLSDEILSVRRGSARLFISCSPWSEAVTLVEVRSLVLLNVPPSPEAFEAIAGRTFRLGALHAELNGSGLIDLWLTHALIGECLAPGELETVVEVLAQTADDVDDELKSRFGGQRFHEPS